MKVIHDVYRDVMDALDERGTVIQIAGERYEAVPEDDVYTAEERDVSPHPRRELFNDPELDVRKHDGTWLYVRDA